VNRDCIVSSQADYRKAQGLENYSHVIEAHLKSGTLNYYKRRGPQLFEYQLSDVAEHKKVKELIEGQQAKKRGGKSGKSREK
jgi:hypothetical protein